MINFACCTLGNMSDSILFNLKFDSGFNILNFFYALFYGQLLRLFPSYCSRHATRSTYFDLIS